MPSSIASRAPDRGTARAKPLLGTTVSIHVHGVAPDEAHRAIDAAFAEVARVHALMSAQEPVSELCVANRAASTRTVTLDRRTAACIAHALLIAEASGGAFDPVAAGGSWRDVRLDGCQLRYARPLCLDLSGIAKGQAVDLACAALAAAGVAAGVVNAGGDLRVFGTLEEPVALRPDGASMPAVLLLTDGALASSDPRTARRQCHAPHRDGRNGAPPPDRFAAVIAPACIDADALTKAVLALGPDAKGVLERYGAHAHLHDRSGWSTIGMPA